MKFIYYLSPAVMGQEIDFDAAISGIKREVEKGNYDALSLLEPLHAKFPDNEELKIYIGRIYSWLTIPALSCKLIFCASFLPL